MHAPILMMPILVLVFGLQAVAAEFFVAPDGNDANAGSRQEPFQTLERARDRVRIAADAAMQNVVAEMKTQRNHIVVPGLAPGQTYFWQVEAIVDQSRSNRGARPADGAPWPFGTIE